MKKLVSVSFVILLVVVILAGCGSPTTTPATSAPATTTPTITTEAPKYGGTLKEISVSVPALVGWPAELVGANSEVPQVCFDPFLHCDNKGNYSAWIATDWQLADDRMSITFTIRDDVDFHDGSHLTAEIAKWNLEKQMEAGRASYWDSVEVLGDYEIKINFTEWRNTLVAAFADGPTTWMVSKQAYDANGEEWINENPVGTGPFLFESFARDTSFVAVRNPDWWQEGKPYLDKYEILFITDPTTQLASMQTGEADVIAVEPGKQTSDMADLGLEINVSIASIFGLVPDTANPDSIWADKTFREAVSYAINRDEIASSLGYGYLEACYQLPPRDNPHYDPNFVGRTFDPDKARELLDEGGYPEGTKATIIVTPLSPSKDAVLAIQAYLADVGVEIALDFPQWSKYVTYLRGTWENAALFQVFHALNGTNYNGTLGFYFDPSGGMLQSWERTDEFLELLNASAQAPNEDAALISDVLDYIYQDVLIIPVHEAGKGYAVRPYVKNGDWLTRSLSPWKFIEQIWLDK